MLGSICPRHHTMNPKRDQQHRGGRSAVQHYHSIMSRLPVDVRHVRGPPFTLPTLGQCQEKEYSGKMAYGTRSAACAGPYIDFTTTKRWHSASPVARSPRKVPWCGLKQADVPNLFREYHEATAVMSASICCPIGRRMGMCASRDGTARFQSALPANTFAALDIAHASTAQSQGERVRRVEYSFARQWIGPSGY